MPADFVLTVEFEALDLLERSIHQYSGAVSRHEMTVEEAEDNAVALALGMMRLSVRET